MASRQHNAALINLNCGCAAMFDRGFAHPLNQSTTASRTPVRHGFLWQHGVTLDADSFHTSKITGSGFAHWILLTGQFEGYGL